MAYYPPSLVRLIKHLSRLPGIGEKTATRLALHILRSSYEDAKGLSESILAVKERVRLCSQCFGLADTDPCNLCASPHRDNTVVCVVEQPSDLVALEKSGAFKGLYHVLHGALSPMNGIGPDDLKIKELMTRIVHVHHPDVGKKLLDQCLARFYWLRKVKGLRKRPSTSELVDWIGALLAAGVQPGRLAQEIPFLGALIKKEEDVEAVGKAMTGASTSRPSWTPAWST